MQSTATDERYLRIGWRALEPEMRAADSSLRSTLLGRSASRFPTESAWAARESGHGAPRRHPRTREASVHAAVWTRFKTCIEPKD